MNIKASKVWLQCRLNGQEGYVINAPLVDTWKLGQPIKRGSKFHAVMLYVASQLRGGGIAVMHVFSLS